MKTKVIRVYTKTLKGMIKYCPIDKDESWADYIDRYAHYHYHALK